MLYMGLDPGETTGVAWVHTWDNTEPKLVNRGQIEGGYRALAVFLNDGRLADLPSDVIFEGFKLWRGRAMSSDQITPAYGIGVIVGWCEANMIPYTEQMPSERTFVTDEVLERLFPGIDLSHKNRHSKDALKHVVTYLVNQKHMPTLKRGWPQDV